MSLLNSLHETFKNHKSKAMKPYLPYIRKFLYILLEEDEEALRKAKVEHFGSYKEALKKVKQILEERKHKGPEQERGMIFRGFSKITNFLGFK